VALAEEVTEEAAGCELPTAKPLLRYSGHPGKIAVALECEQRGGAAAASLDPGQPHPRGLHGEPRNTVAGDTLFAILHNMLFEASGTDLSNFLGSTLGKSRMVQTFLALEYAPGLSGFFKLMPFLSRQFEEEGEEHYPVFARRICDGQWVVVEETRTRAPEASSGLSCGEEDLGADVASSLGGGEPVAAPKKPGAPSVALAALRIIGGTGSKTTEGAGGIWVTAR
jgi:hypothetical protein